jgi:hypothetical protein
MLFNPQKKIWCIFFIIVKKILCKYFLEVFILCNYFSGANTPKKYLHNSKPWTTHKKGGNECEKYSLLAFPSKKLAFSYLVYVCILCMYVIFYGMYVMYATYSKILHVKIHCT